MNTVISNEMEAMRVRVQPQLRDVALAWRALAALACKPPAWDASTEERAAARAALGAATTEVYRAERALEAAWEAEEDSARFVKIVRECLERYFDTKPSIPSRVSCAEIRAAWERYLEVVRQTAPAEAERLSGESERRLWLAVRELGFVPHHDGARRGFSGLAAR